jgi:hypothetical protein
MVLTIRCWVVPPQQAPLDHAREFPKGSRDSRGGRAAGAFESSGRQAARLKEKAEKAKDYRTALAGVREMVRLVELSVRVAIEGQERASANVDFGGRTIQQLTDVEILQILAREPGMTEAKFLGIARGEGPIRD